MAKNEVFENGTHFAVAATDPITPASGDPVVLGQLPGVALTAKDAAGNTTIATEGVFNLPVKGTNGTNAAIAAGDIVYYVAANSPKLSATNTGVRFGYALDPVASGATTTIRVKLGY